MNEFVVHSQLRWWVRSFLLVFKSSFRSFWIRKSFWFGIFVFSVCLLILFPFALGTEFIQKLPVQLGCFWAIMEFVAVVSLGQCFYFEYEAMMLDVFLTSPMPKSTLFIAKIAFLTVQIFSLSLFVFLFWSILFHVQAIHSVTNLVCFLLLTFLFSVSSASLGVVVHGLTSRSLAKEILHPILFFPFQTGVLLGVSSLSLSCLGFAPLSAVWGQATWWTLLFVYPTIFITLAFLLAPIFFEE